MYVENIVIGNPIVEPSSMFAKDEDDLEQCRKRENIFYRGKISSKNLSQHWHLFFC